MSDYEPPRLWLVVPLLFGCAAVCVATLLGIGGFFLVHQTIELFREGGDSALKAVAAAAAILFFVFVALGWAADKTIR